MFSSFIFNLKLLAGQAELSAVQVHFRRELRLVGDVAFVNFWQGSWGGCHSFRCMFLFETFFFAQLHCLWIMHRSNFRPADSGANIWPRWHKFTMCSLCFNSKRIVWGIVLCELGCPSSASKWHRRRSTGDALTMFTGASKLEDNDGVGDILWLAICIKNAWQTAVVTQRSELLPIFLSDWWQCLLLAS